MTTQFPVSLKPLPVLDAPGVCPFPPAPKTPRLKMSPHQLDNRGLVKARDLIDFFESNPIGPGGPYDPIR